MRNQFTNQGRTGQVGSKIGKFSWKIPYIKSALNMIRQTKNGQLLYGLFYLTSRQLKISYLCRWLDVHSFVHYIEIAPRCCGQHLQRSMNQTNKLEFLLILINIKLEIGFN